MFCFASEILTVRRTGRYVCHLFLNFLRRLANVSCISFFSSTSAHASFPVCLFVCVVPDLAVVFCCFLISLVTHDALLRAPLVKTHKMWRAHVLSANGVILRETEIILHYCIYSSVTLLQCSTVVLQVELF